jgi:hypothetical protein
MFHVAARPPDKLRIEHVHEMEAAEYGLDPDPPDSEGGLG